DCEAIRIHLPLELLRWNCDWLPSRGQALALQRPISYVLEGVQDLSDQFVSIECDTALVVADVSADPERAAEAAHQTFANSVYRDMPDTDLQEICELAADVDILLMSVHGDLDADGSGNLEINDEEFDADTLAELEAGLIYFDSCQMGINQDFLESLLDEQNCWYYTAPVISNDAGDSSTRTIHWFFENLQQSGDPVASLFQTKKKLFAYYSERRLNLVKLLNKVLPFRLYEFDA
ncbi:MAG: hypothetical protein KDK39_18580, partial [Leptospiraceae bacterium]|nr:hypothetical protein [Leptospiraceae bacterium]